MVMDKNIFRMHMFKFTKTLNARLDQYSQLNSIVIAINILYNTDLPYIEFLLKGRNTLNNQKNEIIWIFQNDKKVYIGVTLHKNEFFY